MEIEFNVQSELARALAQFTGLRTRDLPFIAATAINMTMKQVKGDLKADMAAVFDRPTPFTLNSLQTAPIATKDSLAAVLRFRDFAGKGTPAWKYLAPEMYGGQRKLKGFERALAAAGVLPQGYIAVPAKDFPLDRYGNIPGSYLVQVLSYLRAFGEQGYTANRAAKGAKTRRRFYVVNDKSSAQDKRGLPWGIYERGGAFNKTSAAKALGINSRLVIAFVKPATYSVQFRFGDNAQAAAAKYFPGNVDKAAHIALEALKRNGAQWNIGDLLRLYPGD